MHWAYALYLFLCTAHTPIYLTLLATGNGITYPQLAPCSFFNNDTTTNNNNNSSNSKRPQLRLPPVCLQEASSTDAIWAVLSCSAFAVAYMSSTENGIYDDDDDSFKRIAGHDGELGVGQETDASLLPLRALFWLFVWFHACVLHAGWPRSLTPLAARATAALRALGVWGLCRCAPRDKGWISFAGSLSLYGAWLWAYTTFFTPMPHGWGLPLLLQCLIFDGLVALCHRYDEHTSLKTMINARLCYTSLSGCVVLLLAMSRIG